MNFPLPSKLFLLCLFLTNGANGWVPQTSSSSFHSLVGSSCSHHRFRHQSPGITTTSKTRTQISAFGSNFPGIPTLEDDMGMNELQTQLRVAVREKQFLEADRISRLIVQRIDGPDDVPQTDDEWVVRRRKMTWDGQGTVGWLIDRLDALNYTIPTTIQVHTMAAVNAILDDQEPITQKSRQNYQKDLGVVVSGSTGSGKTLAFLVPLLSSLSDSLFSRQGLRMGDDFEQPVGSILERALVKSMGNDAEGLEGLALTSLGASGTDTDHPLALIVCPSQQLGIQTARIAQFLLGESDPFDLDRFRGKASIDNYKGPQGAKVASVTDDEEAKQGIPSGTDIAVVESKYLTALLESGQIRPSKLRVVVFDEADLTLEQSNPADLDILLNDNPDIREYSRLVFLVGASVTESLGDLAIRSRVLPEGKSFIATAMAYAPLKVTSSGDSTSGSTSMVTKESRDASLKALSTCLDPGLVHERVLISEGTGLEILAGLLRQALAVQNPRVIVFFPTEEAAREAIGPLRDDLWGEHRVCVLLPTLSKTPDIIYDEFAYGRTTLLIATPNSVRGLDFPDVTHVYTMYLPNDDPREYVHLAGRVGRIGQGGSVRGKGGRVVTILRQQDADKMDVLAKELDFDYTDIERPPADVPRVFYYDVDTDEQDERKSELKEYDEKYGYKMDDDFNFDSTGDEEGDQYDRPLTSADIEKYRKLLGDNFYFVPPAKDASPGDKGDDEKTPGPTEDNEN